MVMSDLFIDDRLTIPAQELEVSFTRAGGPGGQHVNKVNTKVVLRWSVRDSAVLSARQRDLLRQRLATQLTTRGELVISSTKTRHQARNREDVRERLVAIVRDALRQATVRKSTRPSRGAVERRLKDKRRTADRKRSRGRVEHE